MNVDLTSSQLKELVSVIGAKVSETEGSRASETLEKFLAEKAAAK